MSEWIHYPTEDGYYWFRPHGTSLMEPRMVYTPKDRQRRVARFGSTEYFLLDSYLPDDWWCPIAQPNIEEEQVNA
jgi:hypothetical protein